MKVLVLSLLIVLSAGAIQAKSPVLTPVEIPAASKIQVIASADLKGKTRSISPKNFGLNTSWWSGKVWNRDPDRIAKARATNIRFWRFPGGMTSDFYFWNNQYGPYAKAYDSQNSARMAAPEHLNFDGFMEFCRRVDGEAIITLNYGLARYGSLREAIDLAVGWVRYAKEKKFPLHYVEIGNENYGPWEPGSTQVPGKGRLTGKEYAADFKFMAAELKAEDSELKIGLPVCPDDGGEEWKGYGWWNRDVLSALKDVADFVVVHDYFVWPFDKQRKFVPPTKESLLGNLSRIGEIRRNLDDMMDRYAGRRLPVSFNEFNILNASSPETIQGVNLLFTAAALGEMAKEGFWSANFWDWKNGFDAELKGDQGLLASGDPQVPDATPRPAYYAFVLWSHAAGDHILDVKVQGEGLRVYVSRFEDGSLGWILINEKAWAQTVELKVEGFKGKGQIEAWVAKTPSLDSLTVDFNGMSGPKGGGGPFPLAPPYRLKSVHGLVETQLPPYSVTALRQH